MTDDGPHPPPEGKLLRTSRERAIPKLSIRAAAARIGISPEHWGNVERGYKSVSADKPAVPVEASAELLAKMATAAGIPAALMRTEGQRPDAADLMKEAIPAARNAPAGSPALPVPEDLRQAAQPYADAIQDRLLAAAARTGTEDPPGDQVFPAGSWEAQSWDLFRRQFPSTLRRLWIIAAASVPDDRAPGQHDSAAGLAPEAAPGRSSAGGAA